MVELTPLKLHKSLPFPLKISSIALKPGDNVKKHQPILRYSYWEFQDAPLTQEESENPNHIPKKVRVDLAGSFESPIDGVVRKIAINVGEEILSSDQVVAEIEEPCTHSIQYSGLCALCGKSLDDEVDYSGYQYEDRAPISMSHGTSNLKISKDEAEKVEQRWTMNLIGERKLILVVDLDQTVIHATVDPTIGEWMRDTSNPNYPSLKDVKSFTLEEEAYVPPGYKGPKPVPHKRWYFVKARPGLEHFLETVAAKYELHIYTMGTRAYAKKIASCIDPDGKYFADRILSRDESGSMTQKSLERLFPTDTSMVVIIDDRGDVWNWSEHLIKVVPFDFFVGIGDINSNFLPQQKSLLGPTKRRGSIAKLQEKLIEKSQAQRELSKEAEELERKIEEINEENREQVIANGDTQDVLLSEQQNAELLAARSSEREASLEAQKEERPLAKLQKDLDDMVHSKKMERLLYDDDDELIGLENGLVKIHEVFYTKHDALANGSTEVPDIKNILPSLKRKVFEGLTFVFSGLFPLGSNINSENIVIWARSFGAKVDTEVTYNTTHVIARSALTHKTRLAKSLNKDSFIVHPDWVFHSFTNWARADERQFEIEFPQDRYLSEKEVQKYRDRLDEAAKRTARDIEDNVVQTGDAEENEFLGGDMDWLDMGEDDEDFGSDSNDDIDDGDDEYANAAKRSADDEHSDSESKKRRVDGSFADDEDDDDLAAELMMGLDGDNDDDDNDD